MKNKTTDNKHRLPTRGIVNCRCSAYSNGTFYIKSSCNLICKCFEIVTNHPPKVNSNPTDIVQTKND